MRKILVVDDEEPVRNVAEHILAAAGYTVRCVESAEDALTVLEQEAFPVYFLDLFLPNMNGVDLCRIIRERQPEAFIYAITAYALRYDIEDCRKAGFNACFDKPIDAKILLQAAENAFVTIENRGRA
jgi:CheY-like chemotaxis protein